VSALAFGGKPKRVFQLGITRRVDLAISDPIRTEVLRTLRDKFRWSEERLTEASSLDWNRGHDRCSHRDPAHR
jgi:hypothetical protein